MLCSDYDKQITEVDDSCFLDLEEKTCDYMGKCAIVCINLRNIGSYIYVVCLSMVQREVGRGPPIELCAC